MNTGSPEPTILVVEDQPEVLSLLADALKMVGYRVLTAAHPDDGLAIGDEHADQIDLVLTDVVMPGMNGPEMAQRLVFRHPSLRVLYLSGHDRETLGPLGVPEDGPAFLKKPFTLDTLVKRVSGALCR
jgi:DNA-binding response OmpR family regulator